MKTVPVTNYVGLEVQDLDLSKPFSDQELADLREAFDTGGFLLLRDQKLEDAHHDNFVKALGDLHTFRWGTQVEYLSNVLKDNPSLAVNGRLKFHNDGAYRDDIAFGTSLYAQDVSPTSPPTAFANSVRAYESLPEEIKEKIENLHGYNMFDTNADNNEQVRMMLVDYPDGENTPGLQHAIHPVVNVVPHTGKKALFVNEFNTSHLVEYGPGSEEGEELIQLLFQALYNDANVYEHNWTNGDLVLFNNLSVQHARTGRIDHNPRTLRRLVLNKLSW
ncbi:TauD/TfdA family dioxygenase [Streptomyces sp. NPDC050625]|uniref:TauD/TfdA dioxygenase family protein n=1 Tax=Streptomyces sp. NPDC050625 TaxID=3154629 RepID=UPI0034254D58